MYYRLQHIFIYIFWMLCFTAAGSTPFTIEFENGTTIRIHKAEVITDSFALWKNNPNPLKHMFFAYNFPDHIEEYKNLFYNGNYPWEIEKVYDQWRNAMTRITMDVYGIFYGQMDEMEVACIQYAFTENGNTIMMGFLAKRIEGTWYPLEGKQMAQYQNVMGFFGTFQPEIAEYLLHPDESSSRSKAGSILIANCGTKGGTLTESCIYQTAEQWGMSNDPVQIEFENKLFKTRMLHLIPDGKKSAIQKDLASYITSLGLPDEASNKAMYYFGKEESMKAIAILYANGFEGETKTLFATLNTLQQTSQYRTFDRPFEEKPKSD